MRLKIMRETARLLHDHTLSACAAFSSLAVQRKQKRQPAWVGVFV